MKALPVLTQPVGALAGIGEGVVGVDGVKEVEQGGGGGWVWQGGGGGGCGGYGGGAL